MAARGLKGSLDVGVRYRDLRRDVLGHIEVRPQERELVLEELDRLSERRDLGLEVVRVVYRGVALMRVADRGVGFVMIVLSRRELGVAVVPRGVRLIVPVTDRRVGVLVVYAS